LIINYESLLEIYTTVLSIWILINRYILFINPLSQTLDAHKNIPLAPSHLKFAA